MLGPVSAEQHFVLHCARDDRWVYVEKILLIRTPTNLCDNSSLCLTGLFKTQQMRDYRFFVYILTNRRNGTLYVGMTNDLIKRVADHRAGTSEGFTKRYGVTRLVWFEEFAHVDDAITAEKRIKRWRRAWKIALIEEHNPEWIDNFPALAGIKAA
jgi:putative endonuclease